MNLEEERERRGISKEELAKVLNISLKTYYNWINGKTDIPSSKLIDMAEMFNVSIDYLLGIKQKN